MNEEELKEPIPPDSEFGPDVPSEMDCEGLHNWVALIIDPNKDEVLWGCDKCWAQLLMDYDGNPYIEAETDL